MAAWKQFEDLQVWLESRRLAKAIYQLTATFPFCKDYRFCSQIQASAGSVMDNIAEGFERENNKEFIQFLYIAKGSCGEVRSQLQRAKDVGHISEEDFLTYRRVTLELSSAISGFIHYLRESEITGSRNIKS